MAETKIDVRTADGTMDAYCFAPPGGKPAPVVVLISDAFGVRPATKEMCEKLAAKGYFVVIPNVLYRSGSFAPFEPAKVWTDPGERQRLMGIMQKATPDGVMKDLGALFDALTKQPGAKPERVGMVGYCMGGRLSFLAAAAFPERVVAVAAIHAGRVVTDAPDSPHNQAGTIKGRLYFGVADNDPSFTPEQQTQLKNSLNAAKVRYDLEVYPGAKHGFAMADTPEYNAEADAKHWERVFALFAETLPKS
ncbi:MAG: dienelactone hydrolase family protein [Deltaproteobacteria bacterium]|nr:dienelactone hydrolase family protein [Deltaproteobacteria bacterium]